MRRLTLFYFMFVLWVIWPVVSQAAIRPLVTLSAGGDMLRLHNNQDIVLISPFYNSYIGNERYIDFSSGLFFGMEGFLSAHLLGQLGASYYQNNAYQARGTVYQFGDAAMGNLYYQYNLRSQRFFVESKLLATRMDRYHPFLNLGMGVTINKATDYTERGVTSADVSMSSLFRDKTKRAFAYLVGVGVDVDMSEHIRLGGLYRYMNLGRAQLGTTVTQESTDVLKNNPYYLNEIMLQLTILG